METKQEITPRELNDAMEASRRRCGALSKALACMAGIALALALFSLTELAAEATSMADNEIMWSLQYGALIAKTVECASFTVALGFIAALFHNIQKGAAPFSHAHAFRLRAASLALFAGAATNLIAAAIPKLISATQESYVVIGTVATDTGLLVASIVLFSFGAFVDYGSLLQTLSDETL